MRGPVKLGLGGEDERGWGYRHRSAATLAVSEDAYLYRGRVEGGSGAVQEGAEVPGKTISPCTHDDDFCAHCWIICAYR